MRRLLALALLGMGARSLHAQASVPPIVAAGLSAVQAGRIDSAFAVWLNNPSFSDEARAQVMASAPTFADACGRMNGYEILRVVEIGRYLRRYYIHVRCATQPIYIMLQVHQPEGEWLVGTLNWNSEYDRVVPAQLFGPQQP